VSGFEIKKNQGLPKVGSISHCQEVLINKERILEEESRCPPMQEYTDEWLYRRIVYEAPNAVIFPDRDGRIEIWNSGAESIFGFSAQEATGQSLDLIIPEKLRFRHWEGYRKVMATGSTRYRTQLLAVPAMRKDGTRISVEFSMVLVRSCVGEMLGAAAIVRDVTARWQKERELRDRLTALEGRA